jgi:predicted transport protein
MDEATKTMIRNLEEKTGKTLAQWVGIAKGMGALKHGQLVKQLKEEHGMTHGYANLVALAAAGSVGEEAPAGDDLVSAQYSGDKAPLRPIYDRLIAAVEKFGKDVEIAPKKAYVALRRSKQFGLIQPSNKTRVDVGINLKGVAPGERLEASGSFNSMVSHRVRVSTAEEVDAQLIGWLKQAYEGA